MNWLVAISARFLALLRICWFCGGPLVGGGTEPLHCPHCHKFYR